MKIRVPGIGRGALLLFLVALIAGACGNGDSQFSTPPAATPMSTSDGQDPATSTSSPTVAEPTQPGEPETLPTEDGANNAGLELVLSPVASISDPIALAARPNTGGGQGDLYVASRPGQVWLLGADNDEPPEMVLDIGNKTDDACEEGLLGLAFSPDGSRLYVNHTDATGDNSLIVEYPMNGNRVQSEQERRVLTLPQPACNHNGGHLAFGPDGLLWSGFGDGGGANDQYGNGQVSDNLLATIIRLDPEARDAGAYGIPADNPFTNGGGAPEVWAYGARNPWRFSFDRTTGDLWIGDVGQDQWEEIHVLAATDGWLPGANLGWPLFEGTARFSDGDLPNDLVAPIYVYNHDEGCSITGGYVYRGSAIPQLEGVYVFGDFCTGELWGLVANDQGQYTRVDLGVSVPAVTLVSFGEDNSGELYVLSTNDTVYRLEPAP